MYSVVHVLWRDRTFQLSTHIIISYSGVDHDQVVKLAEQHFGKIPAQQSAYKPTRCAFVGADVCTHECENAYYTNMCKFSYYTYQVEAMSYMAMLIPY